MARMFPSKTTAVHNNRDEWDGLNLQFDEHSSSDSEYLELQKCISMFTDPIPVNSVTLTVEKELKLLEANGSRTGRLEKLYQALLTAKPTSTASERVFSIAGIFCNFETE